MEKLVIEKNEAGQRADNFLKKHLNTSVSYVCKLIRTNKVKVNRKKPTVSQRLIEGDVVELYLPPSFYQTEKAFVPCAYSLSVIYEDDNLLLVYKPTGLLSQPDDSGAPSLCEYIKSYLYETGAWDPKKELTFVPAICNRLDRNTEGLVLAAKNAQALRLLNEKIKTREIHKFYLAEVMGAPPKDFGELTGYLVKDRAKNRSKIVGTPLPNSLFVHSRYRVISKRKNTSLLELELLTGRSHQLRVQLAHFGCPIVGDKKYGGAVETTAYQMLTAYKLTFSFESDGGILSYLDGKTFTLPDSALERFI